MHTVTYNDLPPEDPYANVTPHPALLHNHHAEQALLGAILTEPQRADTLRDHVDPTDFYEPRHEAIWDAIHAVRTTGLTPDPLVVGKQLTETGQFLRAGGGTYLHDLMQACPTPMQAEYYAGLVRDAARLRHVNQLGTKFHQLATTATPDDIDHAVAEALQQLDDTAARIGPRHQALIRVPTIDDLLDGDDDTYDWVIPGLIEHQERVIITAEEGAGKSTLLRQIAITTAAGIHPLTGEAITPCRVLHIDVENSLRQSRRQYRPLRIKAGDNLDPDRLRVEIRVQGLDLTQPVDQDWLSKTVAAARPDIIVIGPIYKLATGNPNDEEAAKPVAMALDQIRADSDAAIVLEAHSAKAPSGSRKRPHEPYGWSGWMRWPEVGIFLDTDGKLHHWRGQREERDWPAKLDRGGHWPWTPAITQSDEQWELIRRARIDAARPVSIRDLEQSTGLSRSGIQRLIGNGARFAGAWAAFNTSQHIGDRR